MLVLGQFADERADLPEVACCRLPDRHTPFTLAVRRRGRTTKRLDAMNAT
jgi:hypothetical protein